MMKKYSYKFINNSLLNPFFHERWILPITQRLPFWISANGITLFSFVFSSSGLLTTFGFGHTFAGVILTSLFYFLYLTSDCIDGSYARYTKTASAHGEFLDHFHDIYGIGAIQVSFCYFFDITSPLVIGLLLISTYIYTAERFHLVYHTGCMVFPKFGSWEPLLLTLSIFYVSLIPQVYTFLLNWIGILALISVGVNFFLSGKNFLRAMNEQRSFLAYILITLVCLYPLVRYYTNIEVVLFLFLYNLHFIGSIIAKRLTYSPYPKPDLVGPMLLLCGHHPLAIAFLGARACLLFFDTLLVIPRNKNS